MVDSPWGAFVSRRALERHRLQCASSYSITRATLPSPGHHVARSAEGPRVGERGLLTRQGMPRTSAGQFERLGLGALGVVFGDIGTSPLYALKTCFGGQHAVAPTEGNIRGVLSLVFWAITFVVSLKYLAFVMRADHRGEGGMFTLLALLGERRRASGNRHFFILLGLLGAALLYGDGIITPAISVLSAVEGVAVAEPVLNRLVVPLTAAILVGLFALQKRGTATVGAVFGPIMLLWFVGIGGVGALGIKSDPGILTALLPYHAVLFFAHNRLRGFLVLGAVVLAVTGAEALYADMGYFGKTPIRVAWFAVVLPALVLNYLGQGALLLKDPSAAGNPFFHLVPAFGLYPMIALSTAATVIASQALISGASALTNQAVQLGYLPRFTIRHTSGTEYGQIYVPAVNSMLGVACVALVLAFRSSAALASAYGIAVTGTMAITTLLFHSVMRDLWQWPRLWAWPLSAAFLVVDCAFLGANLVKIEGGGWFPLATALAIFALMSTWHRGRAALAKEASRVGLPMDTFIQDLLAKPPPRVPGTAVFLTSHVGKVPLVLLHHLRHNKMLHERVLLVSVRTGSVPSVPPRDRLSVRDLGAGLEEVVGTYGFMETPNVPALLAPLKREALPGPPIETPLETSYYVGRETLLPDGPARMSRWRKHLFIYMARNAQTASSFFHLPPSRVVELGAEVEL